jgi:hypothetical protein
MKIDELRKLTEKNKLGPSRSEELKLLKDEFITRAVKAAQQGQDFIHMPVQGINCDEAIVDFVAELRAEGYEVQYIGKRHPISVRW